MCRAGRGDGVFGVGLAPATTPLAVRTVDLDDPETVFKQVTRETGAVTAGALDPDELDFAEALQPTEQLPITGGVVGKLSTPRSDPRSSSAAAT